MRTVLLAAAAVLVSATPAIANEYRAEARGGVIWSGGDNEAIAGVAAGYDFDLAPSTFIGAEVSADKILTSGTKVSFGFNARGGVSVPTLGKIYAVGGYTTKPCDFCNGQWTAGAGVQHTFLPMIYGKVEYRHLFERKVMDSANAVVIGVGVKY
ncbi:MAG: hypothetical protein B7Z36_06065 [Novosphingobium sp. 12-63-9]|nr:MAG: hypothetical protein B7Z36_06065 [Novosphingobium sp. 12-63-9]